MSLNTSPISPALDKLYQNQNLSFDESFHSFNHLLKGNLSSLDITALLVSLKTKGEIVEEIAGSAAALQGNAEFFDKGVELVSDSCGTGGDGFNTINISTLVSIVASSFGVKMVKHGNRSVSSNCGSADLIEKLGINIHSSVEQSQALLQQTDFSFLFAPNYHQGVKFAMPVRQGLKTRTIFNLIGPLANPARPQVQLLGVYDKSLCYSFAQILNLLGCKRALVVHGSGLDEIALHDKTHAVHLNNGEIEILQLTPEQVGLTRYSTSELEASDVEKSADYAIAIFKGKAKPAHLDVISYNCGALLWLNNISSDLKECVQMAKEKILSGDVYSHYLTIKELSNA